MANQSSAPGERGQSEARTTLIVTAGPRTPNKWESSGVTIKYEVTGADHLQLRSNRSMNNYDKNCEH